MIARIKYQIFLLEYPSSIFVQNKTIPFYILSLRYFILRISNYKYFLRHSIVIFRLSWSRLLIDGIIGLSNCLKPIRTFYTNFKLLLACWIESCGQGNIEISIWRNAYFGIWVGTWTVRSFQNTIINRTIYFFWVEKNAIIRRGDKGRTSIRNLF